MERCMKKKLSKGKQKKFKKMCADPADKVAINPKDRKKRILEALSLSKQKVNGQTSKDRAQKNNPKRTNERERLFRIGPAPGKPNVRTFLLEPGFAQGTQKYCKNLCLQTTCPANEAKSTTKHGR